MLPGSSLSLSIQSGTFLSPRDQRYLGDYLLDYERGGVDIGDSSEGLNVKDWTGTYDSGDFILEASGVSPTVVLSVPNVREFGFTFDQNMRVFLAYELEDDTSWFYWYDTVGSDFATTQLPDGSHSLRCSIDDKRSLQSNSSDIILSYLRDSSLYFRAQRDRYETEYLLTTGLGTKIQVQSGMNNVGRFQFALVEP